MREAILASIFITGLAATLAGQVSIQTKEKVRPVEYESPMTLEVPFTLAAKMARGSTIAAQVEDLRDFVCDGVSIRMLRIEGRKHGKGVALTFTVLVYNESNHDKKADVTIVTRDGDRTLAKAIRNNIDAEEGKQRERTFTAAVAVPLPETGTVTITLAVRPD